MCTAFSITAGDHYFGRNLDLDYHYNEVVAVTPRGYRLNFGHATLPDMQYAMIGIGTVIDGYPLYYEAVNEKGLCMAGLNFPENAIYHPIVSDKINIASFELIPWVLAQCENITQSIELLQNINICNAAYRKDLPPTPLHWIISDKERSVTVEPMRDGIVITDNPIRILTNNPPFPYHLQNLSNYLNLTPKQVTNRFCKNLELKPYSLGMGAIGLPGDFSSASRFVRCAFVKENTVFEKTELERVSQVFHILDAVSQFEGCVDTSKGYEKTLYSICCNASKGILYYTTYYNRQITAVDMRKEDLRAENLISYPLITVQQIYDQN